MKQIEKKLVLCLFAAAIADGQQTVVMPQQQRKLAFVSSTLIQDAVQALDPKLQPLFRSFSPSLAPQNSGLAAQLSNLPLPSPASGTRYTFDPQLGVYVPSAQSFGPILAERAETIGRGKFFFAVTFQRFQFDRLDELDLRGFQIAVPFTIRAPEISPVDLQGLVRTSASLGINVSQTTAHITYGLTHWLDASYAFPMVTSSISLAVHGGDIGEVLGGTPIATISARSIQASSTGLGDGIARVKATLVRRARGSVAIASDLRIPIGDELNYHGAGAYGIKPFLIASLNWRILSPHINAGYQWNGESFLASETAMQKGKLPGQAFYTVGFDSAVSSRVTLSADFLNQIVLNGPRAAFQTTTLADGSRIRTLDFPTQTRQECNLAVGFKARLLPDLVMTGNILFRLNNSGLRARAVPMVGISYLF